jgi:hypothetical protein
MKQNLTAMCMVCISLLLVSCVFAENQGVVKETRPVAPFNSIRVSSGIFLYLVQGTENSAVVEADESIIDRVVVESTNGDLRISYNQAKGLFRRNPNRGKISVYVTFTRLEALQASSGAQVQSEGMLLLDVLQLTSSSGAACRLEADCYSLNMEASSGGHINLKGAVRELTAKASSGAHINAVDLVAEEVSAEASSGGHINVFCTSEVVASASSGGHVNVYGEGLMRSVSQSSGGSVKR